MMPNSIGAGLKNSMQKLIHDEHKRLTQAKRHNPVLEKAICDSLEGEEGKCRDPSEQHARQLQMQRELKRIAGTLAEADKSGKKWKLELAKMDAIVKAR